MAVPYYGDFAEDDTVLIPFNTFDSNDPSESVTITNLADSDIKVYKDSNDTEIATDGASVLINFDSRTGAHIITIDTSAHSDYSTGSEYAVLIEGTTVDAGTVTAWVGAFSIERACGALARLETLITTVGAAGIGLTAITDNTDEIGALGVGLTEAGGDGDHLDEAGGTGDHLTAINLPNQTMDISGAITGNLIGDVTGNVDGSVATCAAATVSAIGANVITATAINADAITEAKIADNAIAGEHLNATACTKIIDDFETQSQADPTGFHVNLKEINDTATQLEQLMDLTTGEVADADLTAIVVDASVLSHIMTPAADTSTYNASTDSLEAVRDHVGDGTNLPEAGGDGDHLTAINLPNQTMDISGAITGNLIGDVTGNVDGTVTGKTPAETSDVNAQVLDVMGTDAFAEPGKGAPPASCSMEEKISWLYAFWRNKTLTTATLLTMRNDADNDDVCKSTLSDDATTFTKAEYVSG